MLWQCGFKAGNCWSLNLSSEQKVGWFCRSLQPMNYFLLTVLKKSLNLSFIISLYYKRKTNKNKSTEIFPPSSLNTLYMGTCNTESQKGQQKVPLKKTVFCPSRCCYSMFWPDCLSLGGHEHGGIAGGQPGRQAGGVDVGHSEGQLPANLLQPAGRQGQAQVGLAKPIQESSNHWPIKHSLSLSLSSTGRA